MAKLTKRQRRLLVTIWAWNISKSAYFFPRWGTTERPLCAKLAQRGYLERGWLAFAVTEKGRKAIGVQP
jgi:hypothetical protein